MALAKRCGLSLHDQRTKAAAFLDLTVMVPAWK